MRPWASRERSGRRQIYGVSTFYFICENGKADEAARREYVFGGKSQVKEGTLSIISKLRTGSEGKPTKQQRKKTESREEIRKMKDQRNQGSRFSNECKHAQRTKQTRRWQWVAMTQPFQVSDGYMSVQTMHVMSVSTTGLKAKCSSSKGY